MRQCIGSCIKLKDTGNIKDKDSTYGILEITGNKTAVAFLTGGVPELKSASGTVVVDVFTQEVDSNGRLEVNEKVTLSFS